MRLEKRPERERADEYPPSTSTDCHERTFFANFSGSVGYYKKKREEHRLFVAYIPDDYRIILGLGAALALAQGVSAPAIALFTGQSITTLVSRTDAPLDAMTSSLVMLGRHKETHAFHAKSSFVTILQGHT